MLQVIPPDSVKTLQAVTISARSAQAVGSSQNTVEVDAAYLEEHFAPTLAQSLEAIPGVKASSVGAGLSRPIIRGLGYNRMVVSEDGVKHEGQQWGDDHGLEVNQFALDKVEVIKGPATLLYGSDAIGGVLCLTGNVELGRYNIEVHSNHDHHTHSTSGVDCELEPVCEAVNPWVFNHDYDIPAGSTSHVATADIVVPADVDAGDYHFMVRVTDRAGWQQLRSMAIKLQ